MSPYVSQAQSGEIPLSTSDESMTWDLFSVVCHQGKIDTGHYTNFTRVGDEWHYFGSSLPLLSDVLS